MQAAFSTARRHVMVVVLVDEGHVMRVRRVVGRCEGVEGVRVTQQGRRPRSRIDIRCEATHAARIVAGLDACVRDGDIGRLTRFIVDTGAGRS